MKKNKKKLNIKWKNVMLGVVLLICASIVVKDMFMVTVYGWITGVQTSWTWFGLLTFLLALTTGLSIIEYFEEDAK